MSCLWLSSQLITNRFLTLSDNFFFFASELKQNKIEKKIILGYIFVLAVNEFHIKISPFLHQAYLCTRVTAKAVISLRRKSLCVYQCLGDWLREGSLEQRALEQMKIPFIYANLKLTVQ